MPEAGRNGPFAWGVGWAAVLVSLYLPTLAMRFDFIDDGSLVYPQGNGTPLDLMRRTWDTTIVDYQQRGPFRPVLWAHLVAEAEWLRADPFAWRAVHLIWAFLAAVTLLWLLRALGIHCAAALLVAALALWNPYRGETWINLTVTEGIATPYALAALACAVRAARSPRPARWDIAGVACMLAAIGCKNTFAAVVPAQVLLRIGLDRESFGVCWRRHGRQAGLLALTLLFPIAHFLAFKLSWHEGRYQTAGASWAQLWRMIQTVRGAVSLEFLAPGLLLAGLTVWKTKQSAEEAPPKRDRIAGLAGLLLLLCGIAIYLPIDGVAGRYAIPAAWGADLLIAVVLSRLIRSSASRWRTSALVAVSAGLCAILIANLGKQDKFTARAALLWQALEWVEHEVPPNGCLAWRNGDDLTISEAIHFQHHLHARGRGDVALNLLGASAARPLDVTLPMPSYAVSGRPEPPAAGQWQLLREFRISYWGRWRTYRCFLFHGGSP